MKSMADYAVYLIVRGAFGFLNLFPLNWRISFLSKIIYLVPKIIPKYQKIFDINVKIAFPEKGDEWRDELLKENCESIARLVADFARIQYIDRDWAEEHVDVSEPVDEYLSKPKRNKSGRLFVTGHLGSFELCGHCAGLVGYPFSYVYREFKNEYLNAWWNRMRVASGNTAIPRKGALKKVMSSLEGGRDTLILFDQNVTPKHAIFADWFGVPAAVTKAVGVAALKTEPEVYVLSMSYLGNDKYKIFARECNFDELYKDESKSNDEKISIITQETSDVFTSMIKENPQEWFWMHRRWKARPPGEEPVYPNF